MLKQAIVTTVEFCTRYSRQVVGIAILLTIISAIYAVKHFAIDADVNKLISKELPWRQREAQFDKFFPPKEETTLAVIDAPTSELASQATTALIAKLSDQKGLFHSIMEAGGGPFFQKNGLLFLPTEDVVTTSKKLGEAKPVIQSLAQDPNLRGLTTALNYGLIGARMNHYSLDDLAKTLNMVADTMDEAIAGRSASFSWRAMLNGRPPTPSETRRFIEIRPVLDYSALTPGQKSTDAIRKAAADLNIAGQYGARLRLTGPVPIADEEFATVQEGAFVNTAGTILVVLTILCLALRSGRLILAVFVSLLVGLVDHRRGRTGTGRCAQSDFSGVRGPVHRSRGRFRHPVQRALSRRAARGRRSARGAARAPAKYVGAPLTLAAAATAAGFMSFLPTDYQGRLRARPDRRPRHDRSRSSPASP